MRSSSISDYPTAMGVSPKFLRDKAMRIATMTKQRFDEIRARQLGTVGAERRRAIDTQTVSEQTSLTRGRCLERQRFVLPPVAGSGPCDGEPRLRHAQSMGWLEGRLNAIQTAESGPPVALEADPAATLSPICRSDSSDNGLTPAADRDASAGEVPSTEHNQGDDIAASSPNAVILAARRMLITAITRRIMQEGLTAAQAAVALGLTGPKVTKLFTGSIDEFTLDELVNLLPALELSIQVVPDRERCVGHSGHGECPHDEIS